MCKHDSAERVTRSRARLTNLLGAYQMFLLFHDQSIKYSGIWRLSVGDGQLAVVGYEGASYWEFLERSFTGILNHSVLLRDIVRQQRDLPAEGTRKGAKTGFVHQYS